DFGQHLPAIAILTAVFCGLIVSLDMRASRSRRSAEGAVDDPQYSEHPVTPSRFGGSIAVCAAAGMILVVNAPGSLMRVFAEAYDVAARELVESLEQSKWRASESRYSDLITL